MESDLRSGVYRGSLGAEVLNLRAWLLAGRVGYSSAMTKNLVPADRFLAFQAFRERP